MSMIDYSTPVLLQHGEDDGSSDDDGMLCKLDLHCFYELSSKLILSSLCVCFTCIDRVLQQCCTLTFIIYIYALSLIVMKRMLCCGFQSTWKILAFWFQNNELAIIISLLYGPYHFKEVSSYDYANQINCFCACATLPLKVLPFHLIWLWYLTVLDITCRSSWSWEGKGKLTTIKYHSVFWLQLEFQWLQNCISD
jgi:hypothetical protein